MIRGVLWLLTLLLLMAGSVAPVRAGALLLAKNGRAEAEIVWNVAGGETERNAARELAHYLERISGAPFVLTDAPTGAPVEIHVGWTPHVRAVEAGPEGLGPEEWVVRREGRRILLYGGHPRGTLYAVFHFLEDELGVRWWAPGEESVPRRRRLRVGRPDRRGSPAFAYRDIHIVPRAGKFLLHRRLNGHFALIREEWGGAELYGEPWHVHNFHHYVPPETWFERRPDFFSEVGGLRLGENTQLCLTQPDLLEVVAGKMMEFVADSRAEAARHGMIEGRTFGFSPLDAGRPCACAACTALVERHGSRAAPLLQFVNRLAVTMEARSPGIVIDTLAYGHTVQPPSGMVPAANVVIRLAGLYQRNFIRSVKDPSNRPYRELVERWAAVAPRLRIWDYTSVYALHGELPQPNLRALADDYRFYHELGVEGAFVQHEFQVDGDRRDLKLWLLLQWLEDPQQELEALLREFTAGYYGRAGVWVRRYLTDLEDAGAASATPLRYPTSIDDQVYLDGPFLIRSHRLFDRAERAVARDPVLLRRVRSARLSLDRATLVLGPRMPDAALPDLREVARRYVGASRVEIQRRILPARRAEARAEVDFQVAEWLGAAGITEADRETRSRD